ncbi:MAG: hypothetical protein M0Q51_17315 [Bacteroidales bacterium]|nr:hypothetical protein [Bacteroidales bacterium]
MVLLYATKHAWANGPLDAPLNPVPLRIFSLLCFGLLIYGIFLTFYFYGLIGFILLIIIFLVYGWRRSLNPEGYAKAIAGTQIHYYKRLRKKYPDMNKEEILRKVLKSRPGYTDERISSIIEASKNQKGVVNLKHILYSLIIGEYEEIIGGDPDPSTWTKLSNGIDSAIKEDFSP